MLTSMFHPLLWKILCGPGCRCSPDKPRTTHGRRQSRSTPIVSSIPARELRELVEIEVGAGIEIDEHGNEKRVFATSLDMRRL